MIREGQMLVKGATIPPPARELPPPPPPSSGARPVPRKVYVVMICDRHDDPEPHLFTDKDKALAEARAAAAGLGCAVQKMPQGWLFSAAHEEGDAVWVVEKELNAG